MRSLKPLSTLALVLCYASPALAQFGPAVATVVNPDRTVTFQLQAPTATAVSVNFADVFAASQSTPLTRGADGVWSATLGPFRPDLYDYSLTVDGVTVHDPGSATPKPQRAVSTSLLLVPGNPLLDDQDVAHGTVHAVTYNSKVTGTPRPLLVYTPPGYERMSDLPVLFLYHGAGDTTWSWVTEGRAAQILDNALDAGTTMPMVVVIPETYPAYNPTGILDRSVEAIVDQELFTDVIPYVERHFSVAREARCRAIAGLSMGGGQAIYSAFTHPTAFAAVDAMSPAYLGDLPAGTDPQLINRSLERLDVVTGSNDFILHVLQEPLFAKLTAAGITHSLTLIPGGDHSFFVWRPELRRFVEALTDDHQARRFCRGGRHH